MRRNYESYEQYEEDELICKYCNGKIDVEKSGTPDFCGEYCSMLYEQYIRENNRRI